MTIEQDAARYNWLRNNVKEQLTKGSLAENSIEHKTEYVFPTMIAWAPWFPATLSLDAVIDRKMEYEHQKEI